MRLLVALFLVLIATPAFAEDFVCVLTAGGTLTRYVASVDPTKIAPSPTETCTQVSKANTPAQRTLLNTVPRKYLKASGGLLVEMDAAEKGTVDAAAAAKAATRTALETEAATQDLCSSATLADINTKFTTLRAALQTDIDAITTITNAKTELSDMMDRLILAQQKIVRCLLARTAR